MINGSQFYSVLGVFAAMLAGFYAIAKLMLTQATNDRDADRRERKELSEAIKLMAKSSEHVAAATERGATEAKQRNGHLAELVLESTKTNQQLADQAVSKIITTFQHVDAQKVEHQTIIHAESTDDKK